MKIGDSYNQNSIIRKILEHRKINPFERLPEIAKERGITVEQTTEWDIHSFQYLCNQTLIDYPKDTKEASLRTIKEIEESLETEHKKTLTITPEEQELIDSQYKSYVRDMHIIALAIHRTLLFYKQLIEHKAKLYGIQAIRYPSQDIDPNEQPLADGEIPYELLTNKEWLSKNLPCITISNTEEMILQIRHQMLESQLEKLKTAFEDFIFNNDAKERLLLLELTKGITTQVETTFSKLEVKIENYSARNIDDLYHEVLANKPYDNLFIGKAEHELLGIINGRLQELALSILNDRMGFKFTNDFDKDFKTSRYFTKQSLSETPNIKN